MLNVWISSIVLFPCAYGNLFRYMSNKYFYTALKNGPPARGTRVPSGLGV